MPRATIRAETASVSPAVQRRRPWAGLAGVALTAVLLAAPVRAGAQEVPGLQEMRVAEEQAKAAAEAPDLQHARAHLQQGLNCLVGQGAEGYRPRAGDPCHGASALRSLPRKSVNSIRVQKAIRLARVGVTFHDFPPAHYTAQAVQAVLAEGVGN